MPKIVFGWPRGHSDTLNKLLNGGYSDAEAFIRIYIEAIRILEESIRMPATRRSQTVTNNNKNLKQNDLNLDIVLGNQNKKHYTSITDVIK